MIFCHLLSTAYSYHLVFITKTNHVKLYQQLSLNEIYAFWCFPLRTRTELGLCRLWECVEMHSMCIQISSFPQSGVLRASENFSSLLKLTGNRNLCIAEYNRKLNVSGRLQCIGLHIRDKWNRPSTWSTSWTPSVQLTAQSSGDKSSAHSAHELVCSHFPLHIWHTTVFHRHATASHAVRAPILPRDATQSAILPRQVVRPSVSPW